MGFLGVLLEAAIWSSLSLEITHTHTRPPRVTSSNYIPPGLISLLYWNQCSPTQVMFCKLRGFSLNATKAEEQKEEKLNYPYRLQWNYTIKSHNMYVQHLFKHQRTATNLSLTTTSLTLLRLQNSPSSQLTNCSTAGIANSVAEKSPSDARND